MKSQRNLTPSTLTRRAQSGTPFPLIATLLTPCLATRALVVLCGLLALPAFAAFPNGYNACKVVTTQHTMVSGPADLTNYPLTIVLTDADLKTVANGGLVNNVNGYDIAFYPDCSGSGAALKWEVESYNPATGAIVAHILRPTLSRTMNDTVGMFYGGSFSTFQSTRSAVWDSNYKGVWHLTSPSAADSTTNANNGTPSATSPTAATGQLGGGVSFDGATTRYIDVGNAASLGGLSTLTFEGWVKPAGFGDSGFSTIVGSAKSRVSPIDPWEDTLLAVGSNKVFFCISTGVAGSRLYVMPINLTLSTGNWYHIVGVYTGSALIVYQNGVSVASQTGLAAITTPATPSTNYRLGQQGIPAVDYAQVNGLLDEVRISNVARSADWILTEYRNQSAPGTYISAGPRITSSAATRVRHTVIQ